MDSPALCAFLFLQAIGTGLMSVADAEAPSATTLISIACLTMADMLTAHVDSEGLVLDGRQTTQHNVEPVSRTHSFPRSPHILTLLSPQPPELDLSPTSLQLKIPLSALGPEPRANRQPPASNVLSSIGLGRASATFSSNLRTPTDSLQNQH